MVLSVALKIHLGSQRLSRVLPRETVFLQKSPRQKYYRGDYFLAKYTFILQLLILISRQNYRLQIRDITPCGQVPFVSRSKKRNEKKKGLIIESDDSDGNVDEEESENDSEGEVSIIYHTFDHILFVLLLQFNNLKRQDKVNHLTKFCSNTLSRHSVQI